MFYSGEKKLKSFKANLSKLISGNNFMWGKQSLETLDVESLSNLHFAVAGFSRNKLTSFDYRLEKLIAGVRMFYGCGFLRNFTSDLSSLIFAEGMFGGDLSGNADHAAPKLSLDSIANIATTIKNISNVEASKIPYISRIITHYNYYNVENVTPKVSERYEPVSKTNNSEAYDYVYTYNEEEDTYEFVGKDAGEYALIPNNTEGKYGKTPVYLEITEDTILQKGWIVEF